MLTYEFNGNLKEKNGIGPELKVLGKKGRFLTNSEQQSAYRFEKNNGFQFDGKGLGIYFGGSYTIELYFKFDALDSWKRVVDFKNRTTDNGAYMHHGKLNFYNFVSSKEVGIEAGKYCHFVITRDGSTNSLRMYAEGAASAEMNDAAGHGLVSNDGVLNFFYDDLKVANEASSGEIVLLRLYDYMLEEEEVAAQFEVVTDPEGRNRFQPEVMEPEYLMLSGRVKDGEKETAVEAEVEFVVTLSDGREVRKTTNTLDGKYRLVLPIPKRLQFNADAVGYTAQEGEIPPGLFGGREKLSYNINLEPVQVGEAVVMENILFHTGSAELKEDSEIELLKWVQFLDDNPKMKIEVGGHTDNSGTVLQNQRLSEQRAKRVKAFLVKQGIQSDRIKAMGYGGDFPIASNAEAATRRLNRRVEVTLLAE